MADKAARFLALLFRIERAAAVALFAAMTLIMVADVGARELTGVGLSGAPRIAVYCFILMSMLSFGLASGRAAHLRPRVADRLTPESWEPAMMRIQEALMALFSIVFAVVALDIVAETYRLQEVSRTLRIPVWPMQAVFPLVFLIAFVRHGLYVLYPALKPRPPAK